MPKSQLVGVQFRIPPDVKEWLKREAGTQDRSANWLVIKVLSDAMNAGKGDAQAGESARASMQPPATR